MTRQQRDRERRARWHALGWCVICGEPRDTEDAQHRTCWRCREQDAGRYLALRERKQEVR